MQRRRGLNRVGGQEIPIFQQTAASFWSRRLWVTAQNFNSVPEFPKMEDFQPQILYFGQSFFRQKDNLIFWPAEIYSGG